MAWHCRLAEICVVCWLGASSPDLRVPSSIQGTQKASVTEHLFTTSRPTGLAPIELGRQGWCYLWLAAGKGECHNLALKAPVYDSNNGPWRHLAPFCDMQPDELQLSFQMQRQAAFDAVPLDPRSCHGPGVKLCTYRRWFSPAHQVCPVYWEVPMSTAKLQRILRFRMGSHLLPIEQGRHLRLPRHRRVCRLCHTGALGDERHMLLECPALADLRDEYSPSVAKCSGVMARLVWARNQPMVSRYIIACLDRMSC